MHERLIHPNAWKRNSAKFVKKVSKLVHLSDTPISIEEHATTVL
jgi:hypothetical protein